MYQTFNPYTDPMNFKFNGKTYNYNVMSDEHGNKRYVSDEERFEAYYNAVESWHKSNAEVDTPAETVNPEQEKWDASVREKAEKWVKEVALPCIANAKKQFRICVDLEPSLDVFYPDAIRALEKMNYKVEILKHDHKDSTLLISWEPKVEPEHEEMYALVRENAKSWVERVALPCIARAKERFQPCTEIDPDDNVFFPDAIDILKEMGYKAETRRYDTKPSTLLISWDEEDC